MAATTPCYARWLDDVRAANTAFRARIERPKLPVQRTPGSSAVITCMDPRVNLEAIGIRPFAADGGSTSSVRVIRTIGAMADDRSLIVGMFLAGIREIAVLMHTDCGCRAAFSGIGTIVDGMKRGVEPECLRTFATAIGEPFAERLRDWLKAFTDPRDAVRREVAAIVAAPFAPRGLVVHGLLYDLASGGVEIVVDGYPD